MRKLLTALLLIMGIAVSIYGQKAEGDTYILRTWLLTNDEMSGMGKHESLPRETEISFGADGSWQSNHPLNGANSGKWERNAKGKYVLTMGNRKAEVTELSTSKLVIKLESMSSKTTWTWKAAE